MRARLRNLALSVQECQAKSTLAQPIRRLRGSAPTVAGTNAIVQLVEFASPSRRGRPAAGPGSDRRHARCLPPRGRGGRASHAATAAAASQRARQPEVIGEPALDVEARGCHPRSVPSLRLGPILGAVHGSGVGARSSPHLNLRTGLARHDDPQTGIAVRPVRAGSVSRSNPGPMDTRKSCRTLRSIAQPGLLFEQRQRGCLAQPDGALTARRQEVGLGSCRASRSSLPPAARSVGSSRPRTPSGAA
jgi:hypothetical protein